MEFLSIREFSKSPRTALSKLVRDGKAVLTNNGKPAAIMLNVDSGSFEKVFAFIQQVENTQRMNKLEKAAGLAYEDYRIDAELTAFTSLDGDPLYDCFQVRSVSTERLVEKLGQIDFTGLLQAQEALAQVVGLH
jgi:hypothetical protein